MKKPINNFALVLGVLAAVYTFLVIPDIIEVLRQPGAISSHDSADYIRSFMPRSVLIALRSTIYGSGVLLGLAVLVELVDRLRWNALRVQQ